MNSAVSSEKPKAQIVRDVAALLREVRDAGKRTIVVVGPAVVHTGAARAPRTAGGDSGYIGVLFGGNAVATHDIECALYGTSLGDRPARPARPCPAATSTTCAPSTASAAAAASGRPWSRRAHRAASCTRS